MNRRGHLSIKIPQVKLRPAPAKAPRQKQRGSSPMNKMDEEIQRLNHADDEDDATVAEQSSRSHKPWRGICVTFSGLEDKARYTSMVKELGAAAESALTKSVTHVVAVGYDSAKYYFAVEHRIPLMTPEWVQVAYDVWLQGKALDFAEHEEAHRILPFTGLRIAMSGIEDIDRRKMIIKYINSNGGAYSKDLDADCTHLVSSKPTSEKRPSEKIKFALRHNAEIERRRRRGVRDEEHEMTIVYEEWIWDCLAYRGRWNENLYDARKPRRGGKVDAEEFIQGTLRFDKPERKPVVNSSTIAPADVFDTTDPVRIRRRKGGQNADSLMSEIIPKAVSSEGSEGNTLKRRLSEGLEEPVQKRTKGQVKGSMVHLSRTTSFSTPDPKLEKPSSKPFSAAHVKQEGVEVPSADSLDEDESVRMQLFRGITFVNASQGPWDQMEKVLGRRGGILVSEQDWRAGERSDFAVIRLGQKTTIPKGQTTQLVTENWVEACVNAREILSPSDELTYTPLEIDVPIPGMEKLNIHVSGSEDMQATTFTRRLLTALGAPAQDCVTRDITHLVSIRTEGPKVRRAITWGGKIVKHSWLFAMAISGKIEPCEEHELHIPPAALRPQKPLSSNPLGANVSVMSIGGDAEFNIDGPKLVEPTSGTRSWLAQSSVVPSSRALGSTATLINRPENGVDIVMTETASTSPSHETPIPGVRPQPPQPSPQAALAPFSSAPAPMSSPMVTAPSPPLATATSAPPSKASSSTTPSRSSIPAAPGPSKTASMGSLWDKGDANMTEALRKLAEKPSGTPNNFPRRARPSARIKARSPAILSPHISPSKPPSVLSEAQEQESIQPEDDPLLDYAAGHVEESMKISYVDHNSARERRKLMALFGESAAGKKKR